MSRLAIVALVPTLVALLGTCSSPTAPPSDPNGGVAPPAPTRHEAAAECALDFTPIYVIQGSGATTPLAGQLVATQGVVIGDFEGPLPNLRGFYLQDPTGDGEPATSDGIFVFNGDDDSVELGDVVRVTATAEEFQGQTQLSSVTSISFCGTGSVDPVDVELPLPSLDHLERFEGMLVRFPQALVVTDHVQLGRFGQVVMTSRERLAQPTQVVPPGAAARAVQEANALDRIVVDDARNDQNPDPILFGRGGTPLGGRTTLRAGDTAQGIVGVLTYTWAGNAASGNAYRLRPIGALGGGVPTFRNANPRPAAPPAVGGTLRVGLLNLQNYFDTFDGCSLGVGGAPAACRGAADGPEFARQAAKTVATVVAMDVDVLGIVEIENDGYGAESAIADLVARLDGATAPGTWAFVDADARSGVVNALGVDAIKVGLLYRPAAVEPVGTTAALATSGFVNGGDAVARNRPALAQAFAQTSTGAVFVAVVNHLKSKGSACAVPDAGDGQGECNAVRSAAASELVEWLRGDPTGTGDPDVLILGDLNAYAMEDPLTVLRAAGFVDLQPAFGGLSAYTYAFDGQWGSLDHALASATLAPQVTGAAAWHTNADEPSVLDYRTRFKSAGQVAGLYAPDPFRASDHDPLLVGLDLAGPCGATAERSGPLC